MPPYSARPGRRSRRQTRIRPAPSEAVDKRWKMPSVSISTDWSPVLKWCQFRSWCSSTSSRVPAIPIPMSTAGRSTPPSYPRLAAVRHLAPRRLGRELDDLVVAVGLCVAERVRAVVEDELQLALLDALVEPGAPENQAAQP